MKNLKYGSTSHRLLARLVLGGPQTRHELLEGVPQDDRAAWANRLGVTVVKLAKEGWLIDRLITEADELAERGKSGAGRAIKEYAITAQGREALRALLA